MPILATEGETTDIHDTEPQPRDRCTCVVLEAPSNRHCQCPGRGEFRHRRRRVADAVRTARWRPWLHRAATRQSIRLSRGCPDSADLELPNADPAGVRVACRVNKEEVVALTFESCHEATGRTVTKRCRVTLLTALITEVAVLQRTAAQRLSASCLHGTDRRRPPVLVPKPTASRRSEPMMTYQRRRLEYRDVAVTLDILTQRLIAGRRSSSAIVSEAVGRSDEQVMSATPE